MKSSVVAAAAALVMTVGAQAAPTSTVVGNATILGTLYTVSVLFDSAGDVNQQSFNALTPTLTFNTQADAFAAATVLRDTFGAAFDWNPAQSNDGVRVLFGFDGSSYDYVTVSNCCGGSNLYGPFNFSRDSANYFSFAQFTSAVPEPETYALMVAGLGVVGLARRRRAARTA